MKVVQLINYINPLNFDIFTQLTREIGEYKIFASTKMEKNRNWPVILNGLDVTIQKTITLPRIWRHPSGFREITYLQIPIDTFFQLRRINPDWIITTELGPRTLVSMIYKKFYLKTKVAISLGLSEYTELNRGRIQNKFRRWIIPYADLVFVNGQSGKRYLSQFTKSNQKIVIVNYTNDLSQFLTTPLVRDDLSSRRFLFSGQLIPRKGLIEFLSVLNQWAQKHSDQNWELWILGDGPLRKEIEEFPTSENLNITLYGSIEYEKLPEYYKNSGILVFPTFADEWGMVVNEAMASGLIILGSKYSQAVEELVKDGETGWVFSPDIVEDMFAVLEKLFFTSANEKQLMREKARQKVYHLSPEYISKIMVDSLINFKNNE